MPPLIKPVVTLKMSWVRALLDKPEDKGGPCADGLERMLDRLGLGDPSELTAELLRTALEKGGSRGDSGYVPWRDYLWFLDRVLGESFEARQVVGAVCACPLGSEWATLCLHCTVEVVEDVEPRTEAAWFP